MTVKPLAIEGVNPPAREHRPAPARALTDPREPAAVGKSGKVTSAKESDKIREAARQFEAVFLRQLLKTAKFGAGMGEGGYGGMVVEALASGVSQQGGLGLAKAIEDSLSRVQLSQELAKKPNAP
jgi:Rod binding domain-containing protein